VSPLFPFRCYAAYAEYVSGAVHTLTQLSTNMRTLRLEQIEELGTKTMNELEFVAFLEAGGVKRGAEDDEDEGVVKPSKSKKVKA
jgi:hypothetical protein